MENNKGNVAATTSQFSSAGAEMQNHWIYSIRQPEAPRRVEDRQYDATHRAWAECVRYRNISFPITKKSTPPHLPDLKIATTQIK